MRRHDRGTAVTLTLFSPKLCVTLTADLLTFVYFGGTLDCKALLVARRVYDI